MRRFDHIDLRVPDLASVREFYGALLPRLGFTEDMNIPGWLQYLYSRRRTNRVLRCDSVAGTHAERKSNSLLGVERRRSR